METLKDSLRKNELSEGDIRDINRRLLLVVHLSSLQQNICREIEGIYSSRGKYRMRVKHEHERIKALVRKNLYTGPLFGNMSPDQCALMADDADELEKIVKRWAGID